MDQLGCRRYCCRRMIMTHVDLIEKLLRYVREATLQLVLPGIGCWCHIVTIPPRKTAPRLKYKPINTSKRVNLSPTSNRSFPPKTYSKPPFSTLSLSTTYFWIVGQGTSTTSWWMWFQKNIKQKRTLSLGIVNLGQTPPLICRLWNSPTVDWLLMRWATQAEMNKESQVPQLVLGYAFWVALHSTHWDMASREAFAFWYLIFNEVYNLQSDHIWGPPHP